MNPPTKPTDNRLRVYRGGCWLDDEPSWVRAASCYARGPAIRGDDIGFRTRLPGKAPRV